jgi:CubicO group peptidase (beta-lactamase class C family)
MSLVKAQELGLLKLNDDINQYLPFRIVNPHCPDSIITIKHLAQHTSGLRDTRHYEKSYVFEEKIPPVYRNFPFGIRRFVLRQMIKRYNKNREIDQKQFLRNIYIPGGEWYSKRNFSKYAPGHEFNYSNNGAALASMVVENASGMEYTEFIARYITGPLKMKHSGWDMEDFDEDMRSKLYPLGVEIPYYKLITLADGGFIINIEDFSRYLMTVIRGYKGEDNILTSRSYQAMLRKDIHFNQGIFWCTRELNNPHCIGHTGGDPGVETVAFFDTRTNLGYIVFANTNSISGELYKILEAMKKYTKELCDK